VDLRKMSYGEHLESRELAARMSASRQQKGDAEVTMTMGVKASFSYNFARSIVDHNLTDEEGTKLNLSTMQDLQKLDPAVALEIERVIDELNDTGREEDLVPLPSGSAQRSSEEPSTTPK